MLINIKKNSGFTLMETVVALGLGMITTAMMVLIFTFGLKNMRTIRNTQALNSNAIFFLNQINYWIKNGETIVINPNEITITTPTATKVFNDAFFTDNGIDSATINFTEMNRSIRIEFAIQEGSESFSGMTTVAQRSF